MAVFAGGALRHPVAVVAFGKRGKVSREDRLGCCSGGMDMEHIRHLAAARESTQHGHDGRDAAASGEE